MGAEKILKEPERWRKVDLNGWANSDGRHEGEGRGLIKYVIVLHEHSIRKMGKKIATEKRRSDGGPREEKHDSRVGLRN